MVQKLSTHTPWRVQEPQIHPILFGSLYAQSPLLTAIFSPTSLSFSLQLLLSSHCLSAFLLSQPSRPFGASFRLFQKHVLHVFHDDLLAGLDLSHESLYHARWNAFRVVGLVRSCYSWLCRICYLSLRTECVLSSHISFLHSMKSVPLESDCVEGLGLGRLDVGGFEFHDTRLDLAIVLAVGFPDLSNGV